LAESVTGMQDEMNSVKPKRIHALTRPFDDELIVYDAQTHEAHCLNRTAAMVWQECDGETTVQDIAKKLQDKLQSEADAVVMLAVLRLHKAGLLEKSDALLAEGELWNRRDLLKRIRMVAIVAIPIVTSMLVPTPARAASCFPLLHSCTTPSQCCSGHCGLSGINLVCLP